MSDVHIKTDTRELILDAAECIFGRFGYKKTTVEDIANEVGVSRATLYLHFEGKEDIALSWIDRKNDIIYRELLGVSQLDHDPSSIIHKMIVARIMNVFDRACAFTESIDELLAALRPQLFLRRETHHELQANLFQQVIQRGEDLGQFRSEDPARMARMLVIASNSLMPYNLSAKQFSQRELILHEAEDLADFLLQGLLYRVDDAHTLVSPERMNKEQQNVGTN